MHDTATIQKNSRKTLTFLFFLQTNKRKEENFDAEYEGDKESHSIFRGSRNSCKFYFHRICHFSAMNFSRIVFNLFDL